MTKENNKPHTADDLLDALKRAENAANGETKPLEADQKDPTEALYDQVNQERSFIAQKIQQFKNSSHGNYKRAKNAYDTADVLWNKYLKPVSSWANPLLKGLWNLNKRVFNYVAHDSDGNFKKYRAAPAVMVLAAFNYAAVVHTVPFTAKLAFDAVAVEAFSYEGTAVFGQPEMIDAENNVLNVFSCSEYPCEGEIDSIEFRMTDSPWLDLKYAFTRFSSHDPGQLAGAFLSEENVCNYEAYGRRIKFPFVNVQYGFFPHIVSAECTPVNGDNVDQILQEMEVMRLAAPTIPSQ